MPVFRSLLPLQADLGTAQRLRRVLRQRHREKPAAPRGNQQHAVGACGGGQSSAAATDPDAAGGESLRWREGPGAAREQRR